MIHWSWGEVELLGVLSPQFNVTLTFSWNHGQSKIYKFVFE